MLSAYLNWQVLYKINVRSTFSIFSFIIVMYQGTGNNFVLPAIKTGQVLPYIDTYGDMAKRIFVAPSPFGFWMFSVISNFWPF